jgi:hypothetical protein
VEWRYGDSTGERVDWGRWVIAEGSVLRPVIGTSFDYALIRRYDHIVAAVLDSVNAHVSPCDCSRVR